MAKTLVARNCSTWRHPGCYEGRPGMLDGPARIDAHVGHLRVAARLAPGGRALVASGPVFCGAER